MSKKYALPPFLASTVDQAAYQRWLEHKAQAQVRRDRIHPSRLAAILRHCHGGLGRYIEMNVP